jgi:hypothetical protein
MDRSRKGTLVRLAPLAAVVLASPQAFAQAAAGGAQAQGGVQLQPPAPPPPPAPPTTAGTSDHDMFIGRLGVGWFGTRGVPMGTAAADVVQTPVVGVRYWATPMIGIDGGLGFFTTSGSTTVQPAGTSFDSPSRTTFLFHGGVPLALANSGHFSFQVTPELDIGFGSGTNPMAAPMPNQDLSGFILQVGARAGGEVQFGFIGIPQLAIDASVGLFLTSASGKTTVGPASQKVSALTITTSNVTQPWNIFTQNVSVRYYF